MRNGSIWLSQRGLKGFVSAKNSNSCHSSLTWLFWEDFYACHSVMWDARVHRSLGKQQEKIVMIFLVKRDVGDTLVFKMHIEMFDNNVCTNILNGYLLFGSYAASSL